MTGAVVSIAQQKGGSGKTTLAIQLGVAWWTLGKRVAMLDIDPQASLFTWFSLRRRKLGDDEGGLMVQGLSGWRLGGEVGRLRREFDLVLIDNPPHAETDARSALRAADLALCCPASRTRSTSGRRKPRSSSPRRPAPKPFWCSTGSPRAASRRRRSAPRSSSSAGRWRPPASATDRRSRPRSQPGRGSPRARPGALPPRRSGRSPRRYWAGWVADRSNCGRPPSCYNCVALSARDPSRRWPMDPYQSRGGAAAISASRQAPSSAAS